MFIDININSTQDSLTSSSCTSCTIQADKSAYWTPQLYYAHADGTFEEVPNGGMAVYYLDRGNAAGAKPFPKGLRMLSGNSGARAYDAKTTTLSGSRAVADRVSNSCDSEFKMSWPDVKVSFACLDYNHPHPQTHSFGNMTCPDGLRAQSLFPSSWSWGLG